MKLLGPLSSIGLALGVAGCSSTPPLALDPVGPAPTVFLAKAPRGHLVLWPAALPLTTLDDPDLALRSNCRILSSDGSLYRSVRIWASDHSREPARVALPPGVYTVESRAAGHGRVAVPVVVEADRTTVVRLDSESHLRFEGLAASNP
jgi:hypothetical protein